MDAHKRDVDKLRQTIATLDEELLALLEKRAHAARSIGELRRGTAPTLPLDGHASIEAVIQRSHGELSAESLRAIFREIQSACVGLELPVRVAVLGPEGGACYAAAREQFGLWVACLPTANADEALDAVARQRAEFAVLPYETSTHGPVQATIASLTQHDLRIGLVHDSAPNLHVMNRSGKLQEIQKVYATAADRALASQSLTELGQVAIIDVKSPLVACQLAAEDPNAAALASSGTGAMLGLEIARRSMLDDGHGRVRYAIIGPRPSPRTGDDRTAVVFDLDDAPGALLLALGQFTEHGVNLVRVQSRAVQGDGWTYLFFVEAAGHATDRQVVSAFDGVKRLTKHFKVLGSYPAQG
jgi:chorismate mutase/prephenate dehydratase